MTHRVAVQMRADLDRRDFLKVTGMGTAALAATGSLTQAATDESKSVIQLCLVGGPSQLDTWDPKPDAPSSVRGPFRPIATSVPGICISETFPKMARLAKDFALLRTVHHDEAPIHETGQQMLQTGRVFYDNQQFPHFGAVAAQQLASNNVPTWIGLSGPIGHTGVALPQGQSAAGLGPQFDAVWLKDILSWLPESARQYVARLLTPALSPGRADAPVCPQVAKAMDLQEEPTSVRSRYGNNRFGQQCLLARRLVEAGVRVVTVNMFDTVFGRLSWDMHANGNNLAVTMDHYRDQLCPMFDTAYSALLTDLKERCLLDNVLVVASGEFGRTPKINPRGGRDHWAGAWTAIMAGGGVRGGQVVGCTDAQAAYPKDRPISPAEIVATIYKTLGIHSESLGVSAIGELT